jgi:hypothetical protein
MVDYSKWDRMEFSDSDSEGSNNDKDDDDGPRVTSLNQPGKVTIGADGSIQIDQSSSAASSTQQQQKEKEDDLSSSSDLPVVSGSISGNAVDISSLPNAKVDDGDDNITQQQRIEKQLTRNGGRHTTTISTNQGQIHLQIYWSQDRYAVTLRVGFPTTQFPSRTIRVKVVGALKYEDRHSAVGSGSMMTDYIAKRNNNNDDNPSYGSVTIVSVSSESQETVLFNGLLPRPIHLNQDEDEVEFEIENANNITNDDNTEEDLCCDRFVSIIMPKAVPMHGLVLWWDSPIVGFPKIDLSSIHQGDRQNVSDKNSLGSEATKNSKSGNYEAFQKAWDEAHVMFREKMKKKEKQIIS